MRLRLLAVLAILVYGSPAFAQFDTATVVGTVRDASAGVVPGAKVTLTSTETQISVVKISSENGSFEFPAVRPGMYVVTGEKTGFAVALVDAVQVQVGARLRIDLLMPLELRQRKGRGHRGLAADRIGIEPAWADHLGRSDAGASAHLTRVFGPGPALDRRQSGRARR